MDQNTLAIILALLGLLSGSGGLLAGYFSRQERKANATATVVDSVGKALSMWQSISAEQQLKIAKLEQDLDTCEGELEACKEKA